MANITLVGSGASAVHFALSVLDRGHRVVMVDVGREPPLADDRKHGFLALKSEHANPDEYFLGADYQSVVYPEEEAEFYGFPPNKDYVFEGVQERPY